MWVRGRDVREVQKVLGGCTWVCIGVCGCSDVEFHEKTLKKGLKEHQYELKDTRRTADFLL